MKIRVSLPSLTTTNISRLGRILNRINYKSIGNVLGKRFTLSLYVILLLVSMASVAKGLSTPTTMQPSSELVPSMETLWIELGGWALAILVILTKILHRILLDIASKDSHAEMIRALKDECPSFFAGREEMVESDYQELKRLLKSWKKHEGGNQKQ